MNQNKGLIITGKNNFYLLAAFLILFVISVSSMAKADQQELNETTTTLGLENATEANMSDVVSITDSQNNISLIENISQNETSSVPATQTTTQIDYYPLVQVSLSMPGYAKIERGSQFDVSINFENIGNSAASITGVDFSFAPGLALVSYDDSVCKAIEPGQECSSIAKFYANQTTDLGKQKMGVVVRYG